MQKLEGSKTPLTRIPILEGRLGISNMLVKDESQNTFGSWKDRRIAPIVERIRREKPDKVVLITAGNAAYSLARMLDGSGTKVAAIIDRGVAPHIKKKLAEVCFQVIETDLGMKRLSRNEREDLARLSRGELIMDVTEHQSAGYEVIVDELADVRPSAIVVPVGQGEGFDGVCRGVKKHGLNTVVVGVMPLSQEDTIADKLQSHHTHHTRNIVGSMMRLPKGQTQMCAVDEAMLAKTYEIVRQHVTCEPSSAIVFAVGPTLKNLNLKDGPVVFVNSGRGI